MAILTKKYSTENANDFINAVNSTNSTVYTFLSHTIPWNDDNSPPSANADLDTTELSIFDYLVMGKKIANTDIIPMVPRHTWSTNTVYDQFDSSDAQLYTKSFYVITSSNNVFKCLWNNNENASVIEPNITTTSSFDTSDGYRWKFMFNIPSGTMVKFASNNYFPVVPNTAVQTAAVPGSIETIAVTAGGANYSTWNNGTFQAVVNSYAVVLANTASTSNDFYSNSAIYLKSGLGAGQLRDISSYDGTTRTAVLALPLDYFLNIRLANTAGSLSVAQNVNQNTYSISVTKISNYITVGNNFTQSDTGATGTVYSTNTSTYVVVRTSPSVDFVLNYPLVNDAGSATVKTGNVTVNTTSTTVVGTGTTFVASYAVDDYIKVGALTRRVISIANNTRLTVANTFTISYAANLHYNITGVATPISITSMIANGTIIYSDLNGVELPFDTSTGLFQLGELVKQSSTANGIVVFANSTLIRLNSVAGIFAANSTIQGTTSNTSANVTVVNSDPNITLQVTSRQFRMGIPLSSATGNGTVTGLYSIPDQTTEYIVSPAVRITGAATINATAYSVINSIANSVSSVVMINKGQGYTSASATIVANSFFGSNATLSALIGPIKGHGADPVAELGGNYVGISTTFGNTTNESLGLLPYGKYRTFGIMKNPAFVDLYLNLASLDRAKLTISSASNTFSVGEIIYQSSSNAAGVIIYANTTFIELKNVTGTFRADTAGDNIYGLLSTATANTRTAIVTPFTLGSNTQVLYQANTGATAILVSANATVIRVSNAIGTFIAGQQVYDPTTNAYATVSTVKYSNNSKTQAYSTFKQTLRIGFSSNTGAFTNNEVIIQASSNATAVVITGINDVDLSLANVAGTFANNEAVTQAASGASGQILFANSTYLKVTAVAGTFTNTAVVGGTSGATANTIKRTVLVCANVTGTWSMETNNQITGLTSGAVGTSPTVNAISYPDLNRSVGEVLYIENMQPVTRSSTSQETVKLVIKF